MTLDCESYGSKEERILQEQANNWRKSNLHRTKAFHDLHISNVSNL